MLVSRPLVAVEDSETRNDETGIKTGCSSNFDEPRGDDDSYSSGGNSGTTDGDALDIENQTIFTRDETLIIFDWDDTLLPSSWISFRGLSIDTFCVIEDEEQEVLNNVSTRVCEVLRAANSYGQVFIVTNAEEGWVEMSAAKFIPDVIDVLQECNIEVLSARSSFESGDCQSPFAWKAKAFKSVLTWLFPTSFSDGRGDEASSLESSKVLTIPPEATAQTPKISAVAKTSQYSFVSETKDTDDLSDRLGNTFDAATPFYASKTFSARIVMPARQDMDMADSLTPANVVNRRHSFSCCHKESDLEEWTADDKDTSGRHRHRSKSLPSILKTQPSTTTTAREEDLEIHPGTAVKPCSPPLGSSGNVIYRDVATNSKRLSSPYDPASLSTCSTLTSEPELPATPPKNILERPNILSFGDSEAERQALIEACLDVPGVRYKSFKFCESPGPSTLSQELSLILCSISWLTQHDGLLDFKVNWCDVPVSDE